MSNPAPDLPANEQWLKISQVAQMFQVQPSTVRTWINEDDPEKTQLMATKVGNHWRINKQDAIDLGKKRYGITERND